MICVSQYNTNKQNLKKKVGVVDKLIPLYTAFLHNITLLDRKYEYNSTTATKTYIVSDLDD